MAQESHVSSRLSFNQAIEKVKAQINAECFQSNWFFAEELFFIIAEVYMMNDDKPVIVAGENLEGYVVKQVFEQLREENLEFVMSNFQKMTHPISFKKAYLRTALYNSVFELTAHIENLISVESKKRK